MRTSCSKTHNLYCASLLVWGLIAYQCALAQTGKYSWTTIAQLGNPWGVATDTNGAVYAVQTAGITKVEKVGSEWVATSLPLQNNTGHQQFQFHWLATSPFGNLLTSWEQSSQLTTITPSGAGWNVDSIAPNCAYPFTNIVNCWSPNAVVSDASGNLYVIDGAHHTVRKMTLNGQGWTVAIIAGAADIPTAVDGTNNLATFNAPMGITVDKIGNLYVTEYEQNTIRKISPEGADWVVTTIAGLSGSPDAEADGVGQQARFAGPYGITVDSKGALYVLDQRSTGNALRKITPVGTDWIVSTIVVENPKFALPEGIAVDKADNLYVADTGNQTIRLGSLLPSLQATHRGSQVVVSWASSATGFVLQRTSTPDITSSWVQITNGVTTSGDSFTLTTPIDSAGAFFRLQQR